jgi:hypothetical protein
MTPDERELVRDLFDRLAELERETRDPDAERLIREGLGRAPNAVYALVQTVLLQDEGLRSADERIAELEDELARNQGSGQQRSDDSFLGGRRDKWNTGEVLRGGSVPSVGGGDRPMGAPPGFGGERDYQGGYRDEPPMRGGSPYGGPGGEPSRGGSFLGTAAAAAAGMIGGGLLMGGIKSAMGGHGDSKGPFAGALDQLTGGRSGSGSGESGGGDLARQAGLDDIGGGGRRQGAMREETKPEENSGHAWDDDSDLEDDGAIDDSYDGEE